MDPAASSPTGNRSARFRPWMGLVTIALLVLLGLYAYRLLQIQIGPIDILQNNVRIGYAVGLANGSEYWVLENSQYDYPEVLDDCEIVFRAGVPRIRTVEQAKAYLRTMSADWTSRIGFIIKKEAFRSQGPRDVSASYDVRNALGTKSGTLFRIEEAGDVHIEELSSEDPLDFPFRESVTIQKVPANIILSRPAVDGYKIRVSDWDPNGP